MLKSILCNYSDVYMPVKGATTVVNTTATDLYANNAS